MRAGAVSFATAMIAPGPNRIIAVRCPRVRDGRVGKIRFTSAILPPYLRRQVNRGVPWPT